MNIEGNYIFLMVHKPAQEYESQVGHATKDNTAHACQLFWLHFGGACQTVSLWYSVYILLLFFISKQFRFIIANQKLFVFITTGQKKTKGESVKAGHLEGNGP